jgi:hypothetical protein
MSKSDLENKKKLFNDLNKIYKKNKQDIIDWLNIIKIEYAGEHKNKISNLLHTSKIQINTSNEYGKYNLILQWFLNNKDKFTDNEELKLFDNIPSTTFTKISKKIMMQPNLTFKDLNIEEEIKKLKKNPIIDPYNGNEIKISIVLKSEYVKLYEKFITYLTKDLSENDFEKPEIFEKIRNELPTNHIYVLKEIDYIKNLKAIYSDDQVEDKWIDFLVKQKDFLYDIENILDKKGYTVYDHLFMNFYFIKNKKHFKNYLQREIYIDNQEFIHETIKNQIKLINADNLNCYEIIDSMLNFTSEENKGINFIIKKKIIIQVNGHLNCLLF